MKKRVLIIGAMLTTGLGVHAQSWTELGGMDAMSANHSTLALMTDASGTNVYAGGEFTNVQDSTYVSHWNGTSWSELGGPNAKHSNLQIYSIISPTPGIIMTAGNFTNNMNNENQYVDQYNGTVWSNVGSELFVGEIDQICSDPMGNVYAIGQFENADFHYFVAKWNGSSWTELGGVNSFIPNGWYLSVAADANGNVYVAGNFTNTSGHEYVAKWDGTSWSEVGGPNGTFFDYFIEDIRVDPAGNLYATGLFTNAAGNYYIAKWDGTSWSEVGGTNSLAANDAIMDFCFDAAGNLYAAGGFMNGTGVYVARYNGTSWSDVAQGGGFSPFGGYISSIAVTPDGSHLFAGGDFLNMHGNYYVASLTTQPTGLEENTVATVTAYPNPAVSELSVSGMTKGIYRILTLDGRTVQTGKLGQGTIAVGGLQSGVYVLQLEDGTNKQTVRFTKTNQ